MLKPYQKKARFVDLLWSDATDKQINFLTYIKKFYFGNKDIIFIDSACGNGRLTLPLFNKLNAKKAIGYDSSKDMISYAKREKSNKNIQYYIGDLAKFESKEKASLLFCMYTSFNYLCTDDQILSALECFKESLVDGGIAVLDLSNLFDFALMQRGEPRVLVSKNKEFLITQIISVIYDAKNNIWQHLETAFIEKSNGKIKRLDETHKLRYITPTEMAAFCDKVGFKIEKVFFGYSPSESVNEHRSIFILKKQSK